MTEHLLAYCSLSIHIHSALCCNQVNKYPYCFINVVHLWIVLWLFLFSFFLFFFIDVHWQCIIARYELPSKPDPAQAVGQSDGSSLFFIASNKFNPIKRSWQDALPSILEMSWLMEEERGENEWTDFTIFEHWHVCRLEWLFFIRSEWISH